MDDQIYFPGTEPPEYKERDYLKSILPDMQAAAQAHGSPSDLLSFKSTKGYSVASLGAITVFRLCLRGKRHFISVPTIFQDLIPDSFPQKSTASELKYVRIPVEGPMESYTDFLVALAGAAVDRYPKDWDCCSRYMECSDAKMCVHPDKAVALSCGYRKILNSGRIFYGANRNV